MCTHNQCFEQKIIKKISEFFQMKNSYFFTPKNLYIDGLVFVMLG